MNGKIKEEIQKVLIGKDDVIDKVLMAVLAGGHILLEDIPGVGKTTLATAFAKATELNCNRVSFNPDVLPGDITGFTVYDRNTGKFEFKAGAAMCNILLADEINRGYSKTQSALLEAMQEQKVTVDGKTYDLQDPFIVFATSNPVGAAGTALLPESQLDRFMICLSVGYPDREKQMEILRTYESDNPMQTVKKVSNAKEILQMRQEAAKVFVSDAVLDYIIRLCEATRRQGNIELGVSPRGVQALMRMAKASAYMADRNYCVPEDVQKCYVDVCAHRVILNAKSRMKRISAQRVLHLILSEIEAPKIGEEDA